MNNRGKAAFGIVNSNKVCVSIELANLIYDKVEIEIIKQELYKLEKKEQKIELDGEQEKSPHER